MDVIQYNAMHKFVRVLDNPRKPSKEHVRTCKDYVIGREINIFLFGLIETMDSKGMMTLKKVLR